MVHLASAKANAAFIAVGLRLEPPPRLQKLAYGSANRLYSTKSTYSQGLADDPSCINLRSQAAQD